MGYKTYKYRIYPTEKQKCLIEKTFGCCRYVYNRALAIKVASYEREKKSISIFNLMHEMVSWKQDEETKWLNEVSGQALQQSLIRLDKAYTSFFKKIGGFPRFKSKKNNCQSFANPQHTRIDWDKSLIYIPKFKEGIKIILHRSFNEPIKTSTILRTPSGKYFVLIPVERNIKFPNPAIPKEDETVGIDLGLINYATFSDGVIIPNPKHLKRRLKLLKRAQKKLDRKKQGGKNRNKQRLKVARLYDKITNSRKDFLHKLTHTITQNQEYTSVAIEDLSVKGMLENKKNRKIAKWKERICHRSIGDASWGKFRDLLDYKCAQTGKNLLVIGRFEPSSKLCSCGFINSSLTLREREWDCPKCKKHHHRDILAANNVKRFAFCSQRTNKDKLLVPQELREFTPLETCVSKSTKEEMK